MKITLEEVKKRFDELINESSSRESISSWAKKVMDAEDSNTLEYSPKEKEKVIWDAISPLFQES